MSMHFANAQAQISIADRKQESNKPQSIIIFSHVYSKERPKTRKKPNQKIKIKANRQLDWIGNTNKKKHKLRLTRLAELS